VGFPINISEIQNLKLAVRSCAVQFKIWIIWISDLR